MNRQMETPVNNNSFATSRSLNSEHPDNLNLLMSSKEFLDLLREVKIRFDTNPKFYQKEDFLKLIDLLLKVTGTEIVIDFELVDAWIKINSEKTIPNGFLIKRTIENIYSILKNTYIEGDGIEFEPVQEESDELIKINATTGATTTDPILISHDAPIDALNIWENDIIPLGTSVQTILENLLCRELYPNEADPPYLSAPNLSLGLKEFESYVTITDPVITTHNGKFNAPFTIPALPEVTGVTWDENSISKEVVVNNGFAGNTQRKNIALGLNKISYTFGENYSAPGNTPITNLGLHTTKTSKNGEEGSAIWSAGRATTSAQITATGVYPCFWNNHNGVLTNDVNITCNLSDTKEIKNLVVPAETDSIKFQFAFPASKEIDKVEIINPLTQRADDWVPFAGTYEIVTGQKTWITEKGTVIPYNILKKTSAPDGAGVTFKITFKTRLDN